MSQRIKWIDHLRMWGMAAIVLGHSIGQIGGENDIIYHWLYMYHVPLCMLVSGYLFKAISTIDEEKTYIKKVLLREYIPYLFWGLVSIILYMIVIERNSLSTKWGGYIQGLLYGNGSLGRDINSSGMMVWNTPLWYLTCLISLEIILSVLSLISKGNYNSCILFITSVAVATICYEILDIHTLFMEIESAVYLMPFFTIGMLMKQYEGIVPKQAKTKRAATLFSIILIIMGSILAWINGIPAYLSDRYGKAYLLFILSSALICIGVLGLVNLYTIEYKVVQYIGRNTLQILVMHKFPIMICSIIIGKSIGNQLGNQLITAIFGLIVSVISIACCLIVGAFIGKVAPIIIGNYSKAA